MLQTAGKENSVSKLNVDEEELKPYEGAFKDALKELKNTTQVNAITECDPSVTAEMAPFRMQKNATLTCLVHCWGHNKSSQPTTYSYNLYP